MLKAALMNKGVEKHRALEPAEELQVVSALVKQRRDSVDQFTSGGRPDLAEKSGLKSRSWKPIFRRPSALKSSTPRYPRPSPRLEPAGRRTWAG
jgi:hypothetical protein